MIVDLSTSLFAVRKGVAGGKSPLIPAIPIRHVPGHLRSGAFRESLPADCQRSIRGPALPGLHPAASLGRDRDPAAKADGGIEEFDGDEACFKQKVFLLSGDSNGNRLVIIFPVVPVFRQSGPSRLRNAAGSAIPRSGCGPGADRSMMIRRLRIAHSFSPTIFNELVSNALNKRQLS